MTLNNHLPNSSVRGGRCLTMLHAWDEKRLSAEMEAYQEWMDERCETEYQIAEKARNLGKDIVEHVEIPRASDLADRTEKLLAEYLDGLEIADELREILGREDRETTSIEMSKHVAKRMHARTGDMVKAIDIGLRVGLAILTEAVLVAPLEGISNVRLLNNANGSQFVSVDFCGPIRAAGGTAQALAVLITDVVRRELGVGRYVARYEEIERVKEEFGLYRGNLQYKPSPEEIESIVTACPVMVNGESTESEECAGFGNIENVDGTRVRGGVLLVIGEGLCLKAPKVQKHTERLNVEGWDFITHFANKDKSIAGGDKSGFKKRTITPNDRFMKEIIAGRPVFGEPLSAGGFRLRYGRTRATGLAAGSLSPVTMHALGNFISVGTQLKIERPGKACAITPSDALQGPTILHNSGCFGRVDILEKWPELENETNIIWDNGELMLGYGEFLENNKNLVPSGYNRDWWSAEIIESLIDEQSLSRFVTALDIDRDDLPEGIPGAISDDDLENFHLKRLWVERLRELAFDWSACVKICHEFNTAVPPPWNLCWLDLPIEWMPSLHSELLQALVIPANESVEEKWNRDSKSTSWLKLEGAATNWNPVESGQAPPEHPPGNRIEIAQPLSGKWICGDIHKWHGLIKSTVMLLGIPHHHAGDDIILTSAWQGMLEGLGLCIKDDKVVERIDFKPHFDDRIERLSNALIMLNVEAERCKQLELERSIVRIAAETAARQRGEGISATDQAGEEAAAAVSDAGPADSSRIVAAKILLDDHAIEGALHIVRDCSEVRWEHNAPVRIGARMARPEKAAHRLMKTSVNALFPIGTQGGPQRLLTVASSRGNLRVSMGVRECTKCGKPSPFTRCHHRFDSSDPNSNCNGRTISSKSNSGNRRRQGEPQTIPLRDLLESKIEELGIDVLSKIKCVKGLSSKGQTPEPIEKGILRARHSLPVFRDGTVRFDMSDIPVTHFRPCEIGTPWKKLVELGYQVDIVGNPLESDVQILELFPQDFIPSTKGIEHFLNTCNYIDELLIRFYKMEPYYNVKTSDDLVGQMTIALAPHTSGGVLSRIIGFTNASGGYAHTLFHAAKRRNCDGDEDSLMLLLDGLLNFSKEILPANRGGRMDAPLVLTTRLIPSELDKEALNVDTAWFYPRSFYEASLEMLDPNDVANRMDIVAQRIGTIGALRGYGFTHDLTSLDAGPSNSAYKILETMVDKLNAQIALAQKLRAVNVEKVASSVVECHFFPDLRGNLMAFTRQKVRCGRCGEKYRRVPLAGKCIKQSKAASGAAAIVRSDTDTLCGGNLIMTVSEGAVRKYVKVANHVMETYGTSDYTQQKFGVLEKSLDSLFKNDRIKVFTLDDFS
ncbi:MAG TPA: hypothetical protein D7H97_04075 [Candidatus Poseidoniales archaeon]|nr:MAG TPA: hypothetical protein D7H97_04075 [Candidatus Poseidoniales archaeon]